KVKKIAKDKERDFFMSAQEAKEKVLIEKVLEKSYK
ncbi:ATP-dependent Clp protease proteolytic subunit, partial [Campylobacter jejuni]